MCTQDGIRAQHFTATGKDSTCAELVVLDINWQVSARPAALARVSAATFFAARCVKGWQRVWHGPPYGT